MLIFFLVNFVSFLEIYAKLKSNRLIQAEPAELHFSAFELQKDYIKILVGMLPFPVGFNRF